MKAALITGAAVAVAAAVSAPHALAQGDDTLFVPGTGGTNATADDTTPNASVAWLDWGRHGTAPVYCLCNSKDYPATLGPGVGDNSAATGDESVVRFLLAHPGVQNLIGGSQGAGVVYEAAQDPRLAGRPLNLYLYSNMDSPNGMRARSAPGFEIPFVGLKGGVPTNTTGPGVSITETDHEWDPVANAPGYQYSWLVTVPTGIVGFLVYHGALGGPYGSQQIDYRNATVTKNGNYTIITLADPLTPWGQLAAILVGNVAGPQAQFVFTTLAKPLDDVLGGFIKAVGGYDVPGVAKVGPTTPGEAIKSVNHFTTGLTNAVKDFMAIPQKLAKGPLPKVTTPPVAPDTTATAASKPKTLLSLNADQTAKAVTPAKKPATKKPSGNPVVDTIKTVQGALTKALTPPKPKSGGDHQTKADKPSGAHSAPSK